MRGGGTAPGCYCPGTQRRPLRCAGPGSPGLGGGSEGGAAGPAPEPAPAPAPDPAAAPLSGASATRRLTTDPHERELKLRDRIPDRADLSRRGLLEHRQERPDRLDRKTDLLGVLLLFRPRGQAGAAHAQIGQRRDVVEQHVLDPESLELGLVSGPQLFLGGLSWIALIGLVGGA